LKIEKVLVITPVYKEPRKMIEGFQYRIDEITYMLRNQGIDLLNFWLNDGAKELPPEFPTLVEHTKNQGLAITLLEGYKEILARHASDKEGSILIRIDCQEHNPRLITDSIRGEGILNHFSATKTKALILPVWYWVKGQERPLSAEIMELMVNFRKALNPIDTRQVITTYNQKFPMGYQAFRLTALLEIVEKLEEGMEVFRKITGEDATWGLDLLTVISAAQIYPGTTDILFGGWSTPWEENRPQEKIERQREKAKIWIEVAQEMGLNFQ
jgi:hypothetical protein